MTRSTQLTSRDVACPCGWVEGRSFGACCASLVVDGEPASSPEALMRSRYTAFVVRDADHLWRTWHPTTRPDTVGALDGITWTGLRVLEATTDEAAGAGVVAFVASFVTDTGARDAVRERSRFQRRAGRWFYVDGVEIDEAGAQG